MKKKYSVNIIANIVRASFEVEAETPEKAEDLAFELWKDTEIRNMTRVDVSDTSVTEID